MKTLRKPNASSRRSAVYGYDYWQFEGEWCNYPIPKLHCVASALPDNCVIGDYKCGF